MTLNEFFTSTALVQPVVFETSQTSLYPNLGRAQQASSDWHNWKTGLLTSDVNYRHWKTKVKSFENSTFKEIKSNGRGYTDFINNLNLFIKDNPLYEKYKDELTALARLESNFDYEAPNNESSALGWFLFIDSTRKIYSDTNRRDFVNNKQEQLRTAAKHIDTLKGRIKSWGGNPDHFPTLYLAWWHESDALHYIKTKELNTVDRHGIDAEGVFNKAKKLINE